MALNFRGDGLPGTALVSLWAHATDRDADKHFRCSGVFVAPRTVLTVKHVLDAGGALWVLPNTAGHEAYPVIGTPQRHPDLDAALLQIEFDPPGTTIAPCDPDTRFEPPGLGYSLNGFFEGANEPGQAFQILSIDAQHRHHRTNLRHPKGHSGSAIALKGRLWGIATAHYTDPNTHRGCVISIGQLWDGWLRTHLGGAAPPTRQALPTMPIDPSPPTHDLVKATGGLTRLQAHAARCLAAAHRAPKPSDRRFLDAWAADRNGIALTDIVALLAELDDATGPLIVLERIRDLSQSLVTQPATGRAPIPPQTAELIIMLMLVAAERYILKNCPTARSSGSADLALQLDKASVAAIVGACVLDRGLLMAVDPDTGGLRATNVLSDVQAIEYKFTDARQAVTAEIAAALESHDQGMRPAPRRRALDKMMQRGGPSDPEAIRTRLERFEVKHGAGLTFGVPASNVPAPLLDPDARACLEAEFKVPIFFFGADQSATAPDDAGRWQRLGATLMDYADSVVEALHGPASSRDHSPSGPSAASAVPGRTRVFLGYAHSDHDAPLRARVVEHLGVLKHQGLIDLWDDTRIGAGQSWYDEIHAAMSAARVAVLLVSPAFLGSKFILTEEVPKLLAQQQGDGMAIVPVLVRDCAWKQVPWLERLKMRPGSMALGALPAADIDGALAQIANELAELCRKSA